MQEALKTYKIEEIDFIELPCGTLATTLDNIKSYSINLKTKILDCVYYTKEELEAMEKQNKEAQNLNNRVSDVAQYINNNENTIASVEVLPQSNMESLQD